MCSRIVPLLLGALVALVLALSAVGQTAIGVAAGEQIVVTTEPSLDQIQAHTEGKLVVEVKDASGKNVPNVLVDLQLDAPPSNPLISTDVPLVEGKTLLKMQGAAPDGRLEVDYLFPIRGSYHLSVKASPAPGSSVGFTPFGRDLDLSIAEQSSRFANLAVALLVLFLFGMVSGIVIGRSNAAARAG